MSNTNLFKTTASTLKKVAELPRYRHPADLINLQVKPIRTQRMQLEGELEFEKNNYISQLHERLVKQLVRTRKTYIKQSIDTKTKIADSQYQLWNKYLQTLVSQIPQSQIITGEKKQKVYESFLIAKERNQQKMQLSKTVRLFYQISLAFRFDIALHPLVMMRMVYPHIGYLNNFHDQRLTFDEYIKFLEETIAVSKFFYQGHTLHGSQLLSFVFWKSYSQKSAMPINDFCKFLKCFKFDTKPQTLNQQFEYNLKNREGEIKEGTPVRFDFWRNIFLERGL